MSDWLINRVKFAREGSAVERCHTTPHHLRYSVGHHSLDMITLLTLSWQAAHDEALPRAELLIAAAFHDIPERVVGDVPSPIKILLDGALDDIEGRVLRWLGVDVFLTAEEREWLAAADSLELYLWCREQSQMGCQSFVDWELYYEQKWAAKPLPVAMRELVKTSMDRLTETQAREVAGL